MQSTRLHCGPGGMMYVVAGTLLFLAAIYTQVSVLHWGFGLMVGGLFVSVLLAKLMLRGIEIQRILPSHGVAGEKMMLRYHIINRKRWLPVFGLVLNEQWGKRTDGRFWPLSKSAPPAPKISGCPFGWVLHLAPGKSVQAEAPCWPTQRGLLQFESVVLGTSFPFGVVQCRTQFVRPGSVLVYPHFWRVERKTLLRLTRLAPSGQLRFERAGGQEEFFGVREYHQGDSFKMIDWKRSAKTGTLVSREFLLPSPPKVMIALDLTSAAITDKSESAGDLVEKAISVTASLLWDAHFSGCQIGLVVLGVQCPTFPLHHSLPHRMKALKALSMLDVSKRTKQKSALPAEPTVVVCPDSSKALRQFPRAIVLGAENIHHYVSEIKGGVSGSLGRRIEYAPGKASRWN